MLLDLRSLVEAAAFSASVTETSPPATESATAFITQAEQPPVIPPPVIGIVVPRQHPLRAPVSPHRRRLPATQAAAGSLCLVGTVAGTSPPARSRAEGQVKPWALLDDLECLVLLGFGDLWEVAELLGIPEDRIPDELEVLALAGAFGPADRR